MKILLTCLALALTAAPAFASEAVQEEAIQGIRYHTVAYDGTFNRDNARRSAWQKAVTECDSRGGYMTEFHAGATASIVGLAYGIRQEAYATCLGARAASEGPVGSILPIVTDVSVQTSPRLRLSARGPKLAAYTGVRAKAYEYCTSRGEHVEQLSIGFQPTFGKEGEATVAAHLACAPAI